MTTLTGLTSQPRQQSAFILPDGSQVSLYLEYRAQQLGWFFDLTWQTWTLTGLRLTTFPNVLRQWQRIFPFGLAVVGKDNADPLNITDLADGTVTLLVLDATDLATIESVAFTGN